LVLLSVAACTVSLAGAAPAFAAFGYLSTFGKAGSGDGEFGGPAGLDVDSTGNVYVTDPGNQRVQMFDAQGTFLTRWGTPGSGPGEFNMHSNADVGADGAGNVYIVDFNNFRVQKFNVAGSSPIVTFERQWAAGMDAGPPTVVATGSGNNVYVVAGGKKVQRFDGSTGTMLGEWGHQGGSGVFANVSGIATDASGNVYTLEQSTPRVQKFDPSGNFLGQFDVPGGVAGSSPIDVDPNSGTIYVVDADNATIKRLSPDGALIDTFDCPGGLQGLATSPSDRVYATSGDAVRVFGEGGGPCSNVPQRLTFRGDEGVTVNAGAQFTNSPIVSLTIEPPANATDVRISNDGGFQAATTTPVRSDRLYAWALDQSGDERLPKTVYVRFANQVESSPQNFTDDIILDQTKPQVTSATLGEGQAAAAAVLRRFTIRTRARDNASGVPTMQLAVRRANPGRVRRYRKRLTIRAKRTPRYVRVFDGARNRSRWRAIRHR
jgi:streptogramin lyase